MGYLGFCSFVLEGQVETDIALCDLNDMTAFVWLNLFMVGCRAVFAHGTTVNSHTLASDIDVMRRQVKSTLKYINVA